MPKYKVEAEGKKYTITAPSKEVALECRVMAAPSRPEVSS